jgi:hypothetical protein
MYVRPDPNDVYDRIRCRTCGCEWIYHPDGDVCARHRPPTTPPWVGEALARHELAGGVPTREWPEPPGIPPGEFLEAVMARAHENNGED